MTRMSIEAGMEISAAVYIPPARVITTIVQGWQIRRVTKKDGTKDPMVKYVEIRYKTAYFTVLLPYFNRFVSRANLCANLAIA